MYRMKAMAFGKIKGGPLAPNIVGDIYFLMYQEVLKF